MKDLVSQTVSFLNSIGLNVQDDELNSLGEGDTSWTHTVPFVKQ